MKNYKKVRKMKKNLILLIFVNILIVVSFLFYFQSYSIFGDTTFNYNVYNERGKDYDNPIITPPLVIGSDIVIEGFEPQYICKLREDKVQPSISNKECWKGSLLYIDYDKEVYYNYTMIIGEEIKVGDYFYITWQPSGSYRREYDCDSKKCSGFKLYQWNSLYKIRLDGDFLKAYFDDKERVIAINSDKLSNIKIVNDLSHNLDGGVYLRSKNLLLYKESTKFIDFVLSRYENDYKINLDTSTLGYDILSVQPYIKFEVPRTGLITIYDNSLSEITYNIVPNIDTTIDTSIDCSDRECREGFYCENIEGYKICMRGEKFKEDVEIEGRVSISKKEKPNYTAFIILLIIVNLILLIVTLIRKNRKIYK